MSPIFKGADVRPPTFRAFTVKHGAPQFVQFLGDPTFTKICELHYLPLERRGVPCMGEECAFHSSPPRWTAYAPVINWHRIEKVWKRKILLMTESLASLTQEDQRCKIIEVTKTGAYNSAPFKWKIIQDLKESERTSCEPWDIEPDLLKMWGMYALLKKQEKEEIPVEATIPFPAGGAVPRKGAV